MSEVRQFAVFGRIPEQENETRILWASDRFEAIEAFKDQLCHEYGISAEKLAEIKERHGGIYVDGIVSGTNLVEE